MLMMKAEPVSSHPMGLAPQLLTKDLNGGGCGSHTVFDLSDSGVWGDAARDKTGFYKAVLFVPKYLMNMLLK